jgi:hypothetical protein
METKIPPTFTKRQIKEKRKNKIERLIDENGIQ